MPFDLLPYCEDYNCSYAAVASPDNNADSIAYTLRFPFIKVYALNEKKDEISFLRRRFEENNRIQIFHNAHNDSFFEMARMIPAGYPAVFILKTSELALLNWLSNIAALRPRKADVILATNLDTNDSAIFNRIATLFGYTHEIGMIDGAIRLMPAVRASSKDLGFDEVGRA